MARYDNLNMTKQASKDTLRLLDSIDEYMSYITENDIDPKEEIASIKSLIDAGTDPEELKSKIFALVKVASEQVLDMSHYNVQMIASNVLASGNFVEMKTGEGKTLAISPVAVYKALSGEGVHVFTSNDYLAKTNYEQLKPLYETLGLSVGVITSNMTALDKKSAYNCDIVYGSQEIIFDMLRDNTTVVPDNLVFKRADFAIVDEADDLFIDSARTPYIISGNEELEQIEGKSISALYRDANRFVMKEIYQNKTEDNPHIKYFDTEDEFKEVNKNKNYDYGPDIYAIALKNSKQAFLTEAGWLKAFQYYNQNTLNELTNKPDIKKEIISSSIYKKDIDYTIINNDRIKLTMRGLAKATDNFSEFKELNDDFYQKREHQHYINNSLTAYLMLHDGIDYELIDEDGEKKVALVINGRASSGRSYSYGLQQAIELKEIAINEEKAKTNSLEKIKIKKTNESKEIASTSTIAFFQTMYKDYAGLTGTAPKESFYNLYGKDTVEIVKNVIFEKEDYTPRNDMLTRVCRNDEAKLKAIVNDVRKRHANNQPILIGTTSVEESEYIAKKLREEGFSCSVLNARVTDLEEESRIVAEAGKPGAITVATNMAGRGTDIKLGGTIEGAKKEVLEALKLTQYTEWEKQGIDKDQFSTLFAKKFLEQPQFMDDLETSARSCLEVRKKKAIDSGGLYVLGATHNQVKRLDDQLRGRSARQSDPGESKFYCTVDELISLGVHSDYVDSIKNSLRSRPYLEGDIVEESIKKAQDNNEYILSQAIYNSQEYDTTISKFQESIYSQRRRALEGKEDLSSSIYYMIDKTVEDTIGYNIPKFHYVTGTTKLKRSKLDNIKLSQDIKNNFNIEIKPEFIEENFSNIKELATYLSQKVRSNYDNTCQEKTKDEIQQYNQKIILSTLDQTWSDFKESAKVVRKQEILDDFFQSKDHDRIHELKKNFNQSIRQARMEVIQQTFGLEKQKISTLEDKKNDRLLNYGDDINNSYSINNNVSNFNVFSRALEVMLKPIKIQKEKRARQQKMAELQNKYFNNMLKDEAVHHRVA